MFQSLLCWIMVCKVQNESGTAKTIMRFNPCYVGLWSVRAAAWSPACGAGQCFNPCYVGLWSVSLQNPGAFYQVYEFQSLLCWIMVCKLMLIVDYQWTIFGFNPCYVGLWSVRCWLSPVWSAFPRFQSLLCWIMVCKHWLTYPTPAWASVSILVMLDYGL